MSQMALIAERVYEVVSIQVRKEVTDQTENVR